MSKSDAFSVSAAKAFFEAAKRPEVQKAAMAAAKNPVIRNAAINAAKNPETRNQMLGLIGDSKKPTPPPKQSESKPAPPPHRPAPKDYASKPVPPLPQSSSVKPYSSGTSYTAPSAGVSSIVSELQSLQLRKPGDFSSNLCTPSQLKPLRPLNVESPRPAPSSAAPVAVLPAGPTRPPLPKPSVSSNSNYTSGPHAYVSYQFTSTHFDELSSEIGDLIVLKREVDEQWIYGLNTRTTKHGIIPLNYLDIKVPLTTSSSSHAPSYSTPSFSAPQNMAMALYDYSSYDAQDLQFRANDQIKLVEWVNTDWLRGELHGRSGIFPANFVSCPTLHAVPYSSSYSAPSNVPLTTMYAAYDYYSGVADDLVFKAGDTVAILEYVGSDWIKGSCNGCVGLAPMTYLTSTLNKKSPTGLAAISSLGHQAKQLATVIEDHETNDPSNLYVSKGDRIIIVETVDEYLYTAKLEEFKSLPAGLIPKRKVVLD
ncbi:unnamed protein product [Auanema sp. JU1783]|nr:unnamed protein product [Auanema sp. JU1783]